MKRYVVNLSRRYVEKYVYTYISKEISSSTRKERELAGGPSGSFFPQVSHNGTSSPAINDFHHSIDPFDHMHAFFRVCNRCIGLDRLFGVRLEAWRVSASIVLGYLYSFYHGFTLVGPDWMTKDSNFSVFFYLAHAILLLGWCIFGSVAASVVDKDCTRTSLFGMSVAFLVVYYLFSLVHIVLTLLVTG
eukprot:1367301-Amorphochlora_amoeboformis.AAC.1